LAISSAETHNFESLSTTLNDDVESERALRVVFLSNTDGPAPRELDNDALPLASLESLPCLGATEGRPP
jgi:hypothetical protein